MTSLDNLQLDDHQSLSEEEEVFIKMVTPTRAQTGWVWGPLITSVLITAIAVFLNSESMRSRLENIPYYNFSLLGLLFSFTLFFVLFLS
jgi:hypothetical protein